MIYLRRFSIPGDGLGYLERNWEAKRTCYGSRYPFGLFQNKELRQLEFAPVTILCGGNGSGKTTLLNLIGEKLELQRGAPFNRSAFFGGYLDLCEAETASAFDRAVLAASRVITSDDVFDALLDLRSLNEGIDVKRRELLAEYADKRSARFQMRSLEDLDELRKVVAAQRHTSSRYVNDQLMRDIPGQSNGESGFLYFTRHIAENGLYLLDEPENSLSVQFQQKLVQFLEDSVRFYRCQFVIATHSPILLAMRDARIYDLDRSPVSVRAWTEVADVAELYRFFKGHEAEFTHTGSGGSRPEAKRGD